MARDIPPKMRESIRQAAKELAANFQGFSAAQRERLVEMLTRLGPVALDEDPAAQSRDDAPHDPPPAREQIDNLRPLLTPATPRGADGNKSRSTTRPHMEVHSHTREAQLRIGDALTYESNPDREVAMAQVHALLAIASALHELADVQRGGQA